MVKKIIPIFLGCLLFTGITTLAGNGAVKCAFPPKDPNVITINLNCKTVSGAFFFMAAALLAHNSYKYLVGDGRSPVEIRGNNRHQMPTVMYNPDVFPRSNIHAFINGMGAFGAFYVGSKILLS